MAQQGLVVQEVLELLILYLDLLFFMQAEVAVADLQLILQLVLEAWEVLVVVVMAFDHQVANLELV
jgi:hypothetical protein